MQRPITIGYEYAILPQTNKAQMKAFARKPAYKVLRQNRDAHIVYAPAEGIYSRPWIGNESGEIPVTVTLKGKWEIAESTFCKVLSTDDKHTVLRFSCKDGASREVELIKK